MKNNILNNNSIIQQQKDNNFITNTNLFTKIKI
jgi:hypothetical protein